MPQLEEIRIIWCSNLPCGNSIALPDPKDGPAVIAIPYFADHIEGMVLLCNGEETRRALLAGLFNASDFPPLALRFAVLVEFKAGNDLGVTTLRRKLRNAGYKPTDLSDIPWQQ